MTLRFVIQAHFRGQSLSSVHLDYRFQHPKYKNFFFGYTQFVDSGTLEGLSKNANDKERLSYCKEKLNNWDKYFKDPSERRQGVRKSMGSTKWFDVDGIITKHLADVNYHQVMLKIAEGTYSIFEDRVYAIKIAFDKIDTFYNVPDSWSNMTYIFRYIPFDNAPTPFTILSWPLKDVHYSIHELTYKETLNDKFTIYESTTEMNGHYLLKDSRGHWYTVDRHPLYDDKFALLKGRYQIRDHLERIDEARLTIGLYKAANDYFYIGLTD